jgi:diguanylate cyclase (GGDEF)-like protein
MVLRAFRYVGGFLRRCIRPLPGVTLLVQQAHEGKISVEELTSAAVSQGRFQPLVQVIGRILLDLKQQRADRAALEQEIRDRIANRTDHLERKIGSLQVQATRDVLTGLGNRRALDAELPRIIERYRAEHIDTALLMIDVDHFKPLNDTLGHGAGDQLLREIGQLIRSTLRGNDLAFRCGGDEFVVLLYECGFDAGTAVAHRLAAMVRDLTRSLKVAMPPQLSIGVCSVGELEDPSGEALTKIADSRLYDAKAKRPGRRRSA